MRKIDIFSNEEKRFLIDMFNTLDQNKTVYLINSPLVIKLCNLSKGLKNNKEDAEYIEFIYRTTLLHTAIIEPKDKNKLLWLRNIIVEK